MEQLGRLGQKVYRDYPGEMHWNVPYLLNNDRIARDVINVSRIMFGRIPFDSIYGGFKCSWSGGRGSVRDDVISLGYVPGVKEFNSYEITVWLTFSRYNFKDNMLTDEGCWKIVDSLKGSNWGAIVSSDKLAEALKLWDSSIVVKASVIKAVMELKGKNLEQEAEMYVETLNSGYYDYVVPRPEFFVLGGAELIPDSYRDRVEIMVNQFCAFNCPKTIRHYMVIEDFEESGDWKEFVCDSRKNLLECGNNCCIDYNSICELNKMGYKRYKLQGRGMGPRCALDQIGSYIFEPTGVFHILEEQIMENIRMEQAQGYNVRF